MPIDVIIAFDLNAQAVNLRFAELGLDNDY